MGRCHEFGVTVREGCGHPMVAGESSCRCSTCGVLCEGRFAGCASVWAAGPREVTLVEPDAPADDSSTSLVSGFLSAERAGPTRATTAAPTPGGAEDTRGQVFEWLQDSFDGLRSQLRVLSDAVGRQEQALGSMSEAGAAAERLAEMADALPDRIGEAVRGAVASLPVPPPPPGNGHGAPGGDGAGVDRSTTSAGPGSPPWINRGGWQQRLRAIRPAAVEVEMGDAAGTR